jgi:hypothetical protein
MNLKFEYNRTFSSLNRSSRPLRVLRDSPIAAADCAAPIFLSFFLLSTMSFRVFFFEKEKKNVFF